MKAVKDSVYRAFPMLEKRIQLQPPGVAYCRTVDFDAALSQAPVNLVVVAVMGLMTPHE